jgi:hypothetical protein
MPNLSEVFQRRQLPSVGDRSDLYPYRLSEAKCIASNGGSSSIAEAEDWREGLKDAIDFDHDGED